MKKLKIKVNGFGKDPNGIRGLTAFKPADLKYKWRKFVLNNI